MEAIKHVVVLGDLMCSEEVLDSIDQKGLFEVIGEEIYNLLIKKNQMVTVNLEAPITKFSIKDNKGGSPNLKSDPRIINVLKSIPNLLVSGANNHITDYGLQGILETESLLEREKIPYIGFSSNLDKRKEYYGYSISSNLGSYYIISVAQNEFSTIHANEIKYGAYGYNPLEIFDIIKCKNKENVIVLFHAGIEYYQYPSPELVMICRKMIDCGAKAVICQHSHCIGCMEEYGEGIIVYGTGNFLFSYNGHSELSNTSLIPILTFENNNITVEYVPLVKRGIGIRLANKDDKDDILSEFYKRSMEIKDFCCVERKWKIYCEKNKLNIMSNLLIRKSKVFNAIERRIGYPFTKLLLKNRKKNLIMLNYIRCEGINELVRTLLIGMEKEDKSHNEFEK